MVGRYEVPDARYWGGREKVSRVAGKKPAPRSDEHNTAVAPWKRSTKRCQQTNKRKAAQESREARVRVVHSRSRSRKKMVKQIMYVLLLPVVVSAGKKIAPARKIALLVQTGPATRGILGEMLGPDPYYVCNHGEITTQHVRTNRQGTPGFR